MSKLDVIVTALRQSMSDLRTKADGALSKVGPLDQQELGREVLWALNMLQYSVTAVEDMIKVADEIESKLPGEVEAAAALLIETRVSAGELVKKSDNELAVTAAKDAERKLVQEEFNAERAALKLVGERRTELIELHGADAALSVPEEVLSGENFDVVKAELTRRVVALEGVNIKAAGNRDNFASVACAHSFDEEGGKKFDTHLGTILAVAGVKPGGKLPDPKQVEQVHASLRIPGGGAPPVTNPDAPEAGKRPTFAF